MDEENDVEDYKRSAFKFRLPTIPTKEQVKKLIENCKHDDIMMMIFISTFHGLRISEMLKLKWSDVDLEHGEIFVRDAKNAKRSKMGYGKDRVVPLNDMFLDVWKAWKKLTEGQEFVIYYKPEEQRPCIRSVKRMYLIKLRQLYVDCGMNDIDSYQSNGMPKYLFNMHTFRHLCGSNLRRTGVALEDIRDYLGHEHIETTKIYVELCKDDLKESVHMGYAYPKSRLGLPQPQELILTSNTEELRLKNELLDKQLKLAEITAKMRLMEVSPHVYCPK